jgi:L-2-hydroxyglutarate oxidase
MDLPRTTTDCDVAIVGAGIVGLATAHQMAQARPDLGIIVLEKEAAPALHQSGRNSGVIHSGLYYSPESAKAAMVARGRELLLAYCDEHNLAYEICGKIVVATEPRELDRLARLAERGRVNGLEIEPLTSAGVRELEPHVDALAGIHVPAAGIIDFEAVCAALVKDLLAADHQLLFSAAVTDITTRSDRITVAGDWGRRSARVLVNCGGLHSDRVARLAGADLGGVRIVPFRGEFYELTASSTDLVRNLIYPVPDPSFPFLGVHFTRSIHSRVQVGPNAVPALSREGYSWMKVSGRDVAEILTNRGAWQLARRHWRDGAGEVRRSLTSRAFWHSARRLVPDLELTDIVPSRAGVRAQALRPDGTFVEDFLISSSPRAVHVVNAPSPAATAAFEIGGHIADLAIRQLE